MSWCIFCFSLQLLVKFIFDNDEEMKDEKKKKKKKKKLYLLDVLGTERTLFFRRRLKAFNVAIICHLINTSKTSPCTPNAHESKAFFKGMYLQFLLTLFWTVVSCGHARRSSNTWRSDIWPNWPELDLFSMVNIFMGIDRTQNMIAFLEPGTTN